MGTAEPSKRRRPIAPRRPWATSLLLAFCVANWLWSLGGGWCVDVLRSEQVDRDMGPLSSGSSVCSERGYLVIAERWFRFPFILGYSDDFSTRLPPSSHAPYGNGWHIEHAWLGTHGSKSAPTRSIHLLFNALRPVETVSIAGLHAAWTPSRNGNWRLSNRGIAVHWLWLVAFTAIPCAVRWRRFLTLRSRVRQGRCTRCGYDLRASPAGVCPECGTESAKLDSTNIGKAN